MIIVTGTFQVPEENIAAVTAAATEMARATRAEQGCLQYAFWQSLEVPTAFRVYEEWESEAALKAHFDTDHMKAWRGEGERLGVSGRDVKLIEAGAVRAL